MKEQRMIEILQTVRKRGFATTQELAEQLDVSLSTIRRDIAELMKNDLVTYSKNVVIPVSEAISDGPFSFRANINALAKQLIAKEAVRLVKNGSTIFLDSSSTVLSMVETLQTLNNLIIVTNCLYTVQRMRNSRFPVHVIGGEMSNLSHGFYGPLAENAIRQFNFDMAFFSPVGVTPQNYAAETTQEAASIRRAAMEQAKSSVLMFDHTKVGLTRTYNFAHLDEFQYLITDDAKHDFNTKASIHRVRPDRRDEV